jgi:predicted phage-related endonuclease
MARIEDLQKIEEKLKKLKERKKQLEQKIKREKAIEYRYAKEFAFCYLNSFKQGENGKLVFLEDNFWQCFENALCKRAKDKQKCLEERLRFLSQYASELFPNLLYFIRKELEQVKRESK